MNSRERGAHRRAVREAKDRRDDAREAVEDAVDSLDASAKAGAPAWDAPSNTVRHAPNLRTVASREGARVVVIAPPIKTDARRESGGAVRGSAYRCRRTPAHDSRQECRVG